MFQSREGSLVPKSQFRVRDGADWNTVDSSDVFAGKVVVAFGLPGAFTPACSTFRVPRYNELAVEFKRLGVDDVVCISVNDPYVMEAWKFAQRADQITFLPDGNGSFSRGLGMLVGATGPGMGERSWRYSMLVRDCVVERMFVESEAAADQFSTTDADAMLAYVGGVAPADIVLFTHYECARSARARQLLAARGLPWAEVVASPRILCALPGNHTTPQVFIDGGYIGGSDELAVWLSLLPHGARGLLHQPGRVAVRQLDMSGDAGPA